MSWDELYDMLPIHFWNKLDGFYELENLRQRQHWERVRWQTTYLINIQLEKGKKIKPTDLIKFDWDKKTKEQQKITAQELKQIMLKNKL